MKRGGLWGFIDASFDQIIECRFQRAQPFKNGRAAVYENSGGAWVNLAGDWITKKRYSVVSSFGEQGVAAALEGSTLVVVDCDGNEIFRFTGVDGVGGYSGGLSAIRSARSGKWGYIDGSGSVVIDYKYRLARRFSGGRAAVEVGMGKEPAGYINLKGDWIVRFPRTVTLYPFNNGVAVVIGERFRSIFDRSGQEIWRCESD